MVQPIPAGYHSVTPYLMVRDAARALAFYRDAFGADGADALRRSGRPHRARRSEDRRFARHARRRESRQGFVGPQTLGGAGVSLMLYVDDVDATFARAVAAGATRAAPRRRPVLWRSRRHARRSVRPRVVDRHAPRRRLGRGNAAPDGGDGMKPRRPADPAAASRRSARMYTLYGKAGSGSAAVEAALVVARAAVSHRRNGVVGAERRVCRSARGQSARADSDARARRRQRAVRKRRDPDPSRHRASRQQAAAGRDVRARAGGSRARVHRRQLLLGDQHHRLSRALVRRTPTATRSVQERIRAGTRARLHRHWEMFADVFPGRPYPERRRPRRARPARRRRHRNGRDRASISSSTGRRSTRR